MIIFVTNSIEFNEQTIICNNLIILIEITERKKRKMHEISDFVPQQKKKTRIVIILKITQTMTPIIVLVP